jgi:diguanylate cyclase (GGDEF)-like protein
VRLRVTVAMTVIMLPFLGLLATALHGQYRDAALLRAAGQGSTGDHLGVTALLAILWAAIVFVMALKAVEARVLRPLRHLTGVASRLAAGELGSRVDMNLIRMSDMRTLAKTVNAMAQILEKLALTDSLTAIANRRQFDAVVAGEVKRSARMRKGLALLLIDVDKFKDYNDRYGHGAGDLCLKRIAAALQSTVRRPGDLVARYGGEEFVVLLPDTDVAGAHAIAQELLAAVRNLDIAHAAWTRDIVTISIGLAVSHPPGAIEPARLIEQADQALYAAKQAGRDRAQITEGVSCAA